jgi:hypothetical protein
MRNNKNENNGLANTSSREDKSLIANWGQLR